MKKSFSINFFNPSRSDSSHRRDPKSNYTTNNFDSKNGTTAPLSPPNLGSLSNIAEQPLVIHANNVTRADLSIRKASTTEFAWRTPPSPPPSHPLDARHIGVGGSRDIKAAQAPLPPPPPLFLRPYENTSVVGAPTSLSPRIARTQHGVSQRESAAIKSFGG